MAAASVPPPLAPPPLCELVTGSTSRVVLAPTPERASQPYFEPHLASSRRTSRRAAGIVVGAVCVFAGIMIGVASPRWRANAGPAQSHVIAAPVTVKMNPAVVSIEPVPQPIQMPQQTPAPQVFEAAAVPAAAAPAATPAPTAPVQPRVHNHHISPIVHANANVAALSLVTPAGFAGTLAISTKPPCEILIDNARTGLVTPQREIELSPGMHRVTLTNGEANITYSTQVAISADHVMRVVRDFTK